MTSIPGSIQQEVESRYQVLGWQHTADGIPTAWIARDVVLDVLRFLKNECVQPYRMLYDLTCIDERERLHREGQPDSTFTVVYQLLSFDRNAYVRVKVPLTGQYPATPTVTGIWKNANWYEREAWDLFGVTFQGHPHHERLLMPRDWAGHPLRKEHPARGTEMGPYHLTSEGKEIDIERMAFSKRSTSDGNEECIYLNIGPQHPGTHGVLRIVLQLDGEEIVDAFPEIGFHHRAQEKVAERQSWHSYIPYTDRAEYLSGALNNLPYVMAVESLAGIDVPERAKVIRVMMCELFRIISHLVYYGTYAQDLGAMSPVFYMFNDRERAFNIIQAITGGRMHVGWFRIGGVAQDLPSGWDQLVRDFLEWLPPETRRV